MLILLRHTESLLNRANRFTGWLDVPLSDLGIQQALQLKEQINALPLDVVFCSSLLRSQMTACLALSSYSQIPCLVQTLEELPAGMLPLFCAPELNERSYGKLQGRNKEECREEFGKEQVHRWRRGFQDAPPEGESLEMTMQRTIPYFQEKIRPWLDQGKSVLIVAHGNSLRSIVMGLENLSQEAVLSLEIPLGELLFYP